MKTTADNTFAARAQSAHVMPALSPAHLRIREGHTQQFERALSAYEMRVKTWEQEGNATAEARMLDARARLFICAGFRPDGLMPSGAPGSVYVLMYEERIQGFERALSAFEMAVKQWSEQGTEASDGRMLDLRARLFRCAGL